MRILVTGAKGFLGMNLSSRLQQLPSCELFAFDRETTQDQLLGWLNHSEIIYHLAGVNRPDNENEFMAGNHGLTKQICEYLQANSLNPKIIFASSIQAELDNPYGQSKLLAENELIRFSQSTGTPVRIFRLKNLFGKWSRPNYNSVVATFCYNISHDLPITISDVHREIEICYVDDVIARFIKELEEHDPKTLELADPISSYRLTLGELAETIRYFRNMRNSLNIPDFSKPLNRVLYATYTSYLEQESLEERLKTHSDHRGVLAEFLKSDFAGQIFLSRTKPGITRGNHYHHTKTEKFFVIEGEGLLRVRQIYSQKVTDYHLSGEKFQVVNIPPGYTHSIENIGFNDLVTLFWSSETFNPDAADTYYLPVLEAEQVVGN